MTKNKKQSRFYKLTFKQINNIVWKAIVKYTDDKSFSNTWLLLKIKEEFPVPEKEVKKDE